jgi:hypothetical protein
VYCIYLEILVLTEKTGDDDKLSTRICDNRDKFYIYIVNVSFIDSNIPRRPVNVVYVLQLIPYTQYQDVCLSVKRRYDLSIICLLSLVNV